VSGTRGRDTVFEQLLRSVASVSANIAEGFNRSRKRYVNSLDIALGEANEAENWLYKARDAGYLSQNPATERLLTIREIERMLAVLKQRIANSTDSIREIEEQYVAEHEDPHE
jgi:four helix bundle protein